MRSVTELQCDAPDVGLGGAPKLYQAPGILWCKKQGDPMAGIFDPEVALARCFHSRKVVREMIQCFNDDVDKLFPQMQAALAKGDLVEVGRLGHRIMGTVVLLGAQPAEEAAQRLEQFKKPNSGTPSEAEKAINALEYECIALKTALAGHPLAIEPLPDDSE